MFKIKILSSLEQKISLSLRTNKGELRSAYQKEKGEDPVYSFEQLEDNFKELVSFNKTSQLIIDDEDESKLLALSSKEGFIPLLTTINEEKWLYLPTSKEIHETPSFVFKNLSEKSQVFLLNPSISLSQIKEILPYLSIDKKIEDRIMCHDFFIKYINGEAIKSFIENGVREKILTDFTLDQKWQSLVPSVLHVLDWIKSTHKVENGSINKDLSSLSFDKAVESADLWMKKLNEKNANIIETTKDKKLIAELSGGLFLYHLLSSAAKDREGSLMGHCVGGDSYNEHEGIYSIRDEDNQPHVTIELEGSVALQVKGKENGPVAKKYQKATGIALEVLAVNEISEEEHFLAGITEVSPLALPYIISGFICFKKYAFIDSEINEDQILTDMKAATANSDKIALKKAILAFNLSAALLDELHDKNFISLNDKLKNAIDNEKNDYVMSLIEKNQNINTVEINHYGKEKKVSLLYYAIDINNIDLAKKLALKNPSSLTERFMDEPYPFCKALYDNRFKIILEFFKINPAGIHLTVGTQGIISVLDQLADDGQLKTLFEIYSIDPSLLLKERKNETLMISHFFRDRDFLKSNEKQVLNIIKLNPLVLEHFSLGKHFFLRYLGVMTHDLATELASINPKVLAINSLSLKVNYSAFYIAISSKDIKLFESFLKIYPLGIKDKDKKENNLLHRMILEENTFASLYLAEAYPFLLKEKNDKGKTPLECLNKKSFEIYESMKKYF